MGNRKNEVINLLKRFKKKISKHISVNEMILFGSRAMGNEREDSDIDLIIVSPDFEGEKSFKRSPQFYYLWDSKYDVDIFCLTPEEIQVKRKEIGIIQEAVKEGIKIK